MPDSPTDDTVVTSSTDTTPTTTDSTTSVSSTETKPAETMLDRVRAAYKPSEVAPTSETSGSPADADPTKSPAAPSDELSVDELKTTHPRTQERFKDLTSRLKAQGTELQALKPKAEEYDKIDTFIRNAGLSQQDVGSVLQIAAMLRSDPSAARERLQPIMAELNRMLGEVLPAELQQRVEAGYITEEDAKALNRANATAELATRRVQGLTEGQRQAETVSRQKAEVDGSLAAMDTWEKQTAKGDPDWHQKRDQVSELVELAINRKSTEQARPWFPNPDEAKKLLTDSLETVNKRYRSVTPKPRQIDPPVTAGASPRSTPAPKNTMDIIRAQLKR